MDSNKFGNRLRELRGQLTQKQFATKIKISAAALSGYEGGEKNPTLNVLLNISDACDVSLDWLCGLSLRKSRFARIETYDDLFLTFLEMSLIPNFETDLMNEYSGNGFQGSAGILSENEHVKKFFSDWVKMKELYDGKIIDLDLYILWFKEALKKENFVILKDDDMPF